MLAHVSVGKDIDLRDEAVEEFTVVTYDNDGASKVAYGLLQHVLRAHIEVVGRLVEDEKVDRLQQQLYHGQTAPLASAQHLHFLVRGLASEHEGTQYVAYLQPYVAHGSTVDGVEDRQLVVKQLCLVLGEVADADVVADGELPVEGNLAHDALDERRLALAVAPYEGHFLAPFEGEVDVGEDDVVAVGLAHVLADDGVAAAPLCGLELQAQLAAVLLVHLDRDDFLQPFDAALHLHGLGGLVAEALDELARLGNLALLVLVGTQLLLTPFAAQADELVVLHAVVVDSAARDFDGAVGDVVDERPVVAHQHHSLARAGEEALKPLNAVDVEVVGRLVEQQHVGVLEQQLGQLDAHAPASAEFAGRAVEVLGLESQSLQRAFHLGNLAKGFAVVMLFCGVRGFFPESRHGLLPDGAGVGDAHHLWEVADACVLRDGHRSTGRGLQAS